MLSHCLYIPRFLYPFIWGRRFRVFPAFPAACGNFHPANLCLLKPVYPFSGYQASWLNAEALGSEVGGVCGSASRHMVAGGGGLRDSSRNSETGVCDQTGAKAAPSRLVLWVALHLSGHVIGNRGHGGSGAPGYRGVLGYEICRTPASAKPGWWALCNLPNQELFLSMAPSTRETYFHQAFL